LRKDESPEKYLSNGHQFFDNPTFFNDAIMEKRIKGKTDKCD